MIDRLTKSQEALLPIYRDKWIQIGLSCYPANHKQAEQACNEVFKIAGLKPFQSVIWAESPLSGIIINDLLKNSKFKDSVSASVWDSVRDSVRASVSASVRASVSASVWDSVADSVWASVSASVWDSVSASVWDSVRDSVRASVSAACYGQHDANWLGFFDYFLEVCNLEVCKKLIPLMNLAQDCGWWIPYKDTVILQEKTQEVHLKNERIHHDSKPAILYRDGFCIYGLNGIRVRKEIVETPADKLDPTLILSEKNAEVRREIVRKIGIERALNKLGSQTLDKQNDYELITLHQNGDGQVIRPYLKMRNPSTSTWHIEGVPPGIKTVKEALNWRNQDNEETEILT